MSVPFSYPKNVAYGLSMLAGYHRNTFKIETVSASAVGAGRVIRVNLPENAIIDLKSFRWVINSARAGAVVGTTAGSRQVFPFVQGMIQRMEVSVGGISVSQGFNEYNSAFRLLRNARVPTSKSLSIDAALQNQTLDTSVATAQQNIYMVCQDWLSIFGDPSTRFIDTGKTGVISVAITLADDAVLPVVSGLAIPTSSSSTYVLDNFYFTIDCISMSDGMYDELVSRMISRDGYIPLSFNEYTSFQQDNLGGTTNQIRFALNSQSVNKIYGTLRPSDYITRGKAAVATTGGTLVEASQPYFFNFTNFAVTNTSAPFQSGYSINNSPHPAYGNASEIEWLSQLAICENKVAMDSPGNQIGSLLEFRKNKFVAAIRPNHPIDGETRNKFISGYDTRGVQSQIVWNVGNIDSTTLTAAGGFYSAYVLVETTSTLKIGAGRQLEIIQ